MSDRTESEILADVSALIDAVAADPGPRPSFVEVSPECAEVLEVLNEAHERSGPDVVTVKVDLFGVLCSSCKGTGKITNVDGEGLTPAPAGAEITARQDQHKGAPNGVWVVGIGQVAPCQTCKAVKS